LIEELAFLYVPRWKRGVGRAVVGYIGRVELSFEIWKREIPRREGVGGAK